MVRVGFSTRRTTSFFVSFVSLHVFVTLLTWTLRQSGDDHACFAHCRHCTDLDGYGLCHLAGGGSSGDVGGMVCLGLFFWPFFSLNNLYIPLGLLKCHLGILCFSRGS